MSATALSKIKKKLFANCKPDPAKQPKQTLKFHNSINYEVILHLKTSQSVSIYILHSITMLWKQDCTNIQNILPTVVCFWKVRLT